MFSAGKIVAARDRRGAQRVPLARALPAEDARAEAYAADAMPPRLAQEWTALAAEASEPNSFSEHWFIAASLATMGRAAAVRIVEVRRADALIGVIPLAVAGNYGRTPARNIQNWVHHQMFLGAPLVRRGEEKAFWSALLRLLDDADWAPNFLHVTGLVANGPIHDGLRGAVAALGRGTPIVHRESRALLESALDPAAYYEQAVRPKKRKEIRRLRNRLGELGTLTSRCLDDEAELDRWCDAFLALEQAGWKGKEGSALACAPQTEAFFRQVVAAGWQAGALQFRRLDLDDRPIAMLVNFFSAPGSFSFKTAFDESFGQYSPGVLIQLDNLAILDRPEIGWMDSCACEHHPMIDSLWRERREIVRVTVRLKGLRRAIIFAACRALEIGWAALRRTMGRSK